MSAGTPRPAAPGGADPCARGCWHPSCGGGPCGYAADPDGPPRSRLRRVLDAIVLGFADYGLAHSGLPALHEWPTSAVDLHALWRAGDPDRPG